jgi:hypothetical protein
MCSIGGDLLHEASKTKSQAAMLLVNDILCMKARIL